MRKRLAQHEMTLLALGNLIVYVPLAMMVKMASKALFASQGGVPATMFEILPLYTIGNALVLFTFFAISGWWQYIGSVRVVGVTVPWLRWHTAVWGLCTAVQIVTVLWIYAFHGISIVFATLLLKGGVLIMAPVVDLSMRTRRRRIYWPSWIAAGLSLIALIISFLERADVAITIACVADIGIYLVAFFLKLVFMSRWAKTHNVVEKKRYMVEGQTATVAILFVMVIIMAVVGRTMGGDGPFAEVWRGITVLPARGFVDIPLVIGAVSAIGGILATLIMLDRRENTFCIATVQSTSIIAGTIATTLLAIFYAQPAPGMHRVIAVCIMLAAVSFLAYHRVVEKKINAIT